MVRAFVRSQALEHDVQGDRPCSRWSKASGTVVRIWKPNACYR